MRITTIIAALALALTFSPTADAKKKSKPMPHKTHVTIPPSLKPGDKVAILAPASAIAPEKVDSMVATLTRWGYEPVVAPSAKGRYGTYSAPDSARAADINQAFADPEIKAIICTRGGHGSINMLPWLNTALIAANPKWLIGFSDITVLHAVLAKAGVASIHGPMSDIRRGLDQECVAVQKNILESGLPVTLSFEAQPYNQCGTATGRLYGGNLITFNELAETPYDFFAPGFDSGDGIILFIEEICENVYAVERLMARLHMAGKLKKVKGLIFGQFTDCKGDDDFADTEQMLRHRLAQWGYLDKASTMPIVFKIPVGHEWPNFPLVEGSLTTLTSTPETVTITMAE